MKADNINFKALLEDYRQNFANKRVRITTNYNLLSSVDISFSENNFPHLMGWQKVINKNNSSKKIIQKVDNGNFNLKIAQRHYKWNDIKSRMVNYNVLHDIFLEQNVNVFVLTRDMKPNNLNLDIAFVINKEKESVILGFRKNRSNDLFFPTTLHTENLHNQYNRRRRTRITSMKWIEYKK